MNQRRLPLMATALMALGVLPMSPLQWAIESQRERELLNRRARLLGVVDPEKLGAEELEQAMDAALRGHHVAGVDVGSEMGRLHMPMPVFARHPAERYLIQHPAPEKRKLRPLAERKERRRKRKQRRNR